MSSRVYLARCSGYAHVADAVDRGLAALGGMGAFVKSGQNVLVKPNLLTDARPEESVTTHPEVVRAVLRQVKAVGARPWVGDSPANVADLSRVWDRTGVGAVCRDESVPLVNLEKAGSQAFDEDGVRYTVALPVLEADAVINLPKIKTHVLTGLTASVKNLYGVVPGFQKTALHKQYPRVRDFSEMLAMVYGRIRPVLTVADGVVGMDGDGPSAGQPYPLGLIGVSADGVALDAVFCERMGMRPGKVLHVAAAARRGLGVCDPGSVEVEDESAGSSPARACRLPRTVPTAWIPEWLIRWIAPAIWHRPAFGEGCVSCGMCVKACPAGALKLEAGRRPVLDPAACIACCCCHEICPVHAITMRPGPVFRFVDAIRPRRCRGRERA